MISKPASIFAALALTEHSRNPTERNPSMIRYEKKREPFKPTDENRFTKIKEEALSQRKKAEAASQAKRKKNPIE